MRDEDKTKEQLINELKQFRQENTKLEKSETDQEQVKEVLREGEKRYRQLFEGIGDALQCAHGRAVVAALDLDPAGACDAEPLCRLCLCQAGGLAAGTNQSAGWTLLDGSIPSSPYLNWRKFPL